MRGQESGVRSQESGDRGAIPRSQGLPGNALSRGSASQRVARGRASGKWVPRLEPGNQSNPQSAIRNPQFASRRRGALLSYELILVVPIVIALAVALVEFGLLWSASHKVQLAAQVACRVGTRPCDQVLLQDEAVRAAAERALIDGRLVKAHKLTFQPAAHTGEAVAVEISVPMGAASPDMLALFGYSLKDRFLVSRVVMSKE